MGHFLLRAVGGLLVCMLCSVSAQADIGSAMVTFLGGKVNARVGGGECAHMATEALRVGGGEFIPKSLGTDYPGSGDYVWGTLGLRIK